MIVTSAQIGGDGTGAPNPDEALSTRLRDLALVSLDALVAGVDGAHATALVAAYAEDVGDALREARTRIAALRAVLAGPDPLNALELPSRQRASDAGIAGAARARDRLLAQAEAGRSLARIAELAAALLPALFAADRRHSR